MSVDMHTSSVPSVAQDRVGLLVDRRRREAGDADAETVAAGAGHGGGDFVSGPGH